MRTDLGDRRGPGRALQIGPDSERAAHVDMDVGPADPDRQVRAGRIERELRDRDPGIPVIVISAAWPDEWRLLVACWLRAA